MPLETMVLNETGLENGAWWQGRLQVRSCGTIITQYIPNRKCYISKCWFGSSLAALDLMYLKERGDKKSLEQEGARHFLFPSSSSAAMQQMTTNIQHASLPALTWGTKNKSFEREGSQ